MIGNTVYLACQPCYVSFMSQDVNRAQMYFNVISDFGKQLWKQLIAADFHFENLDWFKAQSCFFVDDLPKGTELGPLYEPRRVPFAATF